MASYPEYSQSITSSRGDDFQLYPYQVTAQGYPALYAPQPQSMNIPFGTYNVPQSYPQNTHQDFVLGTEADHQEVSTKTAYYPQTPAHSPTNSATNSFDLQPPILSSTSDSGASVQSNLSSAIGSPSMSVHQSREWNQMPGSIPSIVHQDTFPSDNFAHSGFEYEPMMASKYPGYVGESRDVSSASSFSPVNDVPVSLSSFSFSGRAGTPIQQAWGPTGPQHGAFKSPAMPASRRLSSPTSPSTPRVRARGGSVSYSPFFSQSSGTYGAPLEFSCRFSSLQTSLSPFLMSTPCA